MRQAAIERDMCLFCSNSKGRWLLAYRRELTGAEGELRFVALALQIEPPRTNARTIQNAQRGLWRPVGRHMLLGLLKFGLIRGRPMLAAL